MYDGKELVIEKRVEERTILFEARGSYPHSPVLEVTSKLGTGLSDAERIALDQVQDPENPEFWQGLASKIKSLAE
jgi:hypothetical protein